MANESSQTFKYKNFKQILSYYSKLVKQAMMEPVDGLSDKTPFLPAKWKIPVAVNSEYNYNFTEQYKIIYNSGHTYGQGLLDAFQTTSNNILEALRTLFINYDDPKEMQQEDFNFNLINAYASASQSLQWYNSTTEEFEDMPEYWFTRGCWYEMLPMCTKGDYLKTWHGNVVQAVNAIKKCRRYYQYEFEYYLPEPVDNDGYVISTLGSRRCTFQTYGNDPDFIQAFWSHYRKTLEDEVNPLLDPIWRIGRATNLKEQTAETAKLTYVTQLASDIDTVFSIGKTLTSTAKTLSDMCGTFSANLAGLKLSK